MIIDLEKAKEEFLKYTEKFNLEDENIKRKQLHSLRVMTISKEIAEKLGLNQEEIELATLIGLLHDIARFEQYTQFQTFSDVNSFDHGDYGVEILNKDIRKYIKTNEYDEIIKKAIKNHNKYRIEEGLTEREELFAKIIRDADKLDIFYESVNMFWIDAIEIIENDKIDVDVEEQFYQLKQIRLGRIKKYKRNSINKVITITAFIFDINFKASFEILKEKDYINQMINRFKFKDEETKEKIEKVRKIANKYIEEKIKE